jgi:YD repeat-containing protein
MGLECLLVRPQWQSHQRWIYTYTWNERNQLIGLTGGTSGSFAYDALGRRRSKTVGVTRSKTVGVTTTNFLYDGLNFVQKQTSGGTPTANLTGLP